MGWGDEDEHGEAKAVTPREVGVTAQQRRGQLGGLLALLGPRSEDVAAPRPNAIMPL